MPQTSLYPIARTTAGVCDILSLSPSRVLRRAGLPADYLEHEGKGSTAQQAFNVFAAICDEAKRDDLPLYLGKYFASGPLFPPMYAFCCSQNVEIGVTRLALFKSLVAPIKIEVTRVGDVVSLSFQSSDPRVAMPPDMALFELIYFLECCRTFTAEHIVPLDITLPKGATLNADLLDFFGVTPQSTGIPAIHLSHEDATRPLISADPQLQAGFEKELSQQLAEKSGATPMAVRVRSTVMEMLPAGQSSVDAACDRLCLSRRSLQRKLRDENTSFQTILEEVRAALSLHYLQQNDMSVEEISYLLAYRDPNSFYRAFHGWTGMTPTEAKTQHTPEPFKGACFGN